MYQVNWGKLSAQTSSFKRVLKYFYTYIRVCGCVLQRIYQKTDNSIHETTTETAVSITTNIYK